jgi:sugar phosphate permease
MALGGGDAAGWSIFFMLVVILAVLSGVVFVLIRMARREAANLDPDLQDNFPSAHSSH